MKTLIGKLTITLAVVLVVFGAVGYATSTNFLVHDALAVVGGSGGCGSCGDTSSDGGDGGGTPPPITPTCDLSLNVSEVENIGDSYQLTWTGGPSSATFFINGSEVPDSGTATFTFTGPNYDRFHMVGNNGGATCEDEVRVTRVVHNPPSCDLFTAAPTQLPLGGGDVTLNWKTTEATNASIDGQSVAGNGSMVIANVTSNRTFTLNLSNAYGSDSCTASVTVPTDTPAPSCDSFTASPTTLPIGGGNTTLTWNTTNADTVKLDGVVVADDGSKTVAVSNSKTFNLTVSNASGTDSCTASVTVPTDTPAPSCDSFTASPSSLPVGGGNTTLTWNTTNADIVKLDGTVVADDGSQTVYTSSDRTYTLTVSNAYGTDSCTARVDVDTSGGGGGGSTSPRCRMTISDDEIDAGDEVTIEWTTTRVDEVTLKDNHGNILIDQSDDRDDLDSSITLRPTKDTTYTLIGERGSRDTDCEVDVEVKDGIVVSQVRTQFPVAGISLEYLPYTGFEAGPVLTTIFYTLLALWGLFVAYVAAVRRDMFGGISFAGAHDHVAYTDASSDAQTEVSPAETYVAAVTEPTTVPENLPTGIAPAVVGYAAARGAATMTDEEAEASIEMTELENRAHLQHTLFSSDAMRYFTKVTPANGRDEALDTLIAQAKALFPVEDGWLVINLARLEQLLETTQASAAVTETTTGTINGGSLAEAIVSGNVVAAYELIAHRPMIALADAASELDALKRLRAGETISVSDMLVRESATLTDAQLAEAISALTGALDGTYSSEEEAVKMAIMKAVKAVA